MLKALNSNTEWINNSAYKFRDQVHTSSFYPAEAEESHTGRSQASENGTEEFRIHVFNVYVVYWEFQFMLAPQKGSLRSLHIGYWRLKRGEKTLSW